VEGERCTVEADLGPVRYLARIYYEPRCVEGNYSLQCSCTGGAWKSWPLRRDEVLIRQPGQRRGSCRQRSSSPSRMPPETRKAVEAWAKRQDDEPSLSEAIRRMVEIVLKSD
jgi:hypothetical protein